MKRMKKYFFIVYSGFFSLIFISCASVQPVIIEVRKPAQVALPPEIAKVIVVDNSVVQPGDVGVVQTYNELSVKGSLSFDLKKQVIQSFGYTLTKAKFFNDVSFSRVSLRDDNDWMLLHKPIPVSVQRELMDTLEFDGIISLDRLLFSVEEKVKDNMPGDKSFPSHYIDLKIEAQAHGSVYIYNQETPLYTFSVKDSLFAKDTFYEDSLTVMKYIPEVFLKDLAREIGDKMAAVIIPSWIPQERYIYSSSDARSREALSYTKKDNWRHAAEIWQMEYDKKTKVFEKAKIANNIAVAYEIEDNLDEAIRWAALAEELFAKGGAKADSPEILRIQTYRKNLTERKRDNLLLNEQIEE